MEDWKKVLEDKHPISIPGIEVGDGWRPLIEAFYSFFDNTDAVVEIAQIKEKFGTLRIYVSLKQDFTDADYHKVYSFISGLEYASACMCEVCGAYGSTRSGGWVQTLCDEHARKD